MSQAEEMKEPPKSSVWGFLKTKFYNVSYSFKSTSEEELLSMVAKDAKGNWLINPKIIFLNDMYPKKARNGTELVKEI